MKYIGLDIGDKNIGIAISSGIIAQGLCTYKRVNDQSDIEYIKKIVVENSVFKVVVGLPKNMNGSIGFQGEKVIKFCENLKKILEDDVEIELVGLCTDICVVSNALLLKAKLPETKIIVDSACCAGVTPQSHADALNTMKMCQCVIK